MKIFYIANVRFPTEKAHGVQIMKACEAFADAGHEVRLFVSDRATHTAQDPFDFYGVRRNFTVERIVSFDAFRFERYLGPLSFWMQSISFLINAGKIAVPSDALVYTRSAEISWLFSRKGSKVAYEAHAWPESKGLLLKRLLARTRFVICNSKGTESEFKKREFANTLAVPNGVDTELFTGRGDPAEFRKELGFPRDKKIVMYTGHLYAWKGVDVVFGAARILLKRNDILFVLVGGTESDVKKYKELAGTERLGNVMLCGHQKQSMMPKYLACADVLLLPNVPVSRESERYTSPIKMFEYMASRRPIVASDLPSVREVLNERNAILVYPGDAKALVEGIQKALGGDAVIDALVAQAFADAQEYTWEKRAQKILHFLNR